jgi:superfamily II DNA or RNA helicase
MTDSITLQPGSLVKVRGREWVVQPGSLPDLVMVKPLGGLDEELVGILPSIERIESASFAPPDPKDAGDHIACRLLRDAARISTRFGAGPFRSFAKIAVQPRPYQLVPLLMALRLDPVRLLIADDVGIGKTIEACLIARELLDRGEIHRFAVLCPPHLAEQWQRELRNKFHIDAELVLSSTIGRLERSFRIGHDESIFSKLDVAIISTDFIKQPRHRDELIRDCPELVIVDEAHTCTPASQQGRGRQLRFELLKRLSAFKDRHLLLVTATPHSGNEDAFRSLLSLLDPEFQTLPSDLDRAEREGARRKLARHFAQRRREDILAYLGTDTKFPKPVQEEFTYKLSDDYKRLFAKVLSYARELVQDESGDGRHRRIREWSALSLLRALASSPAAAAATLRARATTAEAASEDEVDELGRRYVFDLEEADGSEPTDISPGGDTMGESDDGNASRRRLQEYAREADGLAGTRDAKLQKAIELVKRLVRDGRQPILFCRFVDTAEYLGAALREAMTGAAAPTIDVVTGSLAPEERERRIEELAKSDRRVLVCTDCLSEGVNLQEPFDTILHYDLSWNPTRHEQREGRVNRFGQPRDEVWLFTYYGTDNQIDGLVLSVLLRKHKAIKSALGVSVPFPKNAEDVMKAITTGLLLRGKSSDGQLDFEGWFDGETTALHTTWDADAERAKTSRSRFAQHAISTDEVKLELDAVRTAIGGEETIRDFLRDVLHLARVPCIEKPDGRIVIELKAEHSRSLTQRMNQSGTIVGRLKLPVNDDELYLARTSPTVAGLASWVLETALDPVVLGNDRSPVAKRTGVSIVAGLTDRVVVLLLRARYHLSHGAASASESTTLIEETKAVAFTGTPNNPTWLADVDVESLISKPPVGNVGAGVRERQLQGVVDAIAELGPRLDSLAKSWASEVLTAHQRVRQAHGSRAKVTVVPVLPPDILGCFVLLPPV